MAFAVFVTFNPSRINIDNMITFVLTALWAWSLIFPSPVAAEAQHATLRTEKDIPGTLVERQHTTLRTEIDIPAQLLKRQNGDYTGVGDGGVCKAFGVDFQDGGSYFLDQRSEELFRAGTRFEG